MLLVDASGGFYQRFRVAPTRHAPSRLHTVSLISRRQLNSRATIVERAPVYRLAMLPSHAVATATATHPVSNHRGRWQRFVSNILLMMNVRHLACRVLPINPLRL